MFFFYLFLYFIKNHKISIFVKKGGAFQWPPAREEEGPSSAPTYIDPNNHQQAQPKSLLSTQQNSQLSTQQSSQQIQSQQHYSYQQTSSVTTQQQKPVSILKQPSSQPSSQQYSAPSVEPETFTVGPGQSVTAPRRGKGELQEQKPGMRVPVCGACDGQIR